MIIFNIIDVDKNKKIVASYDDERPEHRKFVTSFEYINDEQTVSAEWGLSGYSSVTVFRKHLDSGHKADFQHWIMGDLEQSSSNWSALAGDECLEMFVNHDIDGIFEKLKGFCK